MLDSLTLIESSIHESLRTSKRSLMFQFALCERRTMHTIMLLKQPLVMLQACCRGLSHQIAQQRAQR